MAKWMQALAVALAAWLGICSAVAQTVQDWSGSTPGRPVSLKLWGSDVTVREFLSLAYPDMLLRIPRDAWNTKVTWGADTMVFHLPSGTPPPTKPKDPEKDDKDVGLAFVIYIHCTNSITHMGQRDVYYGASNTVTIPPFLRMPYMEVMARLWWLVSGLPYLPVGITYNNGWNVWRVTTNNITRVFSAGQYQVESYHFVEGPPGAQPPYQFTVRWSHVIQVP